MKNQTVKFGNYEIEYTTVNYVSPDNEYYLEWKRDFFCDYGRKPTFEECENFCLTFGVEK